MEMFAKFLSASAALMFILFHKRVCGALANSLFHHRPDEGPKPASKLKMPFTRLIMRFNSFSICLPPPEF